MKQKRDQIQIDKEVANTPGKAKKTMREVMNGEGGFNKAIKMKCCDCMGFEDHVERVRTCDNQRCALWHLRPYQEVEEKELYTEQQLLDLEVENG